MKSSNLTIDPIFAVIHTRRELDSLLSNLRDLAKIVSSTSRKKVSTAFKQLPSIYMIPIQEIWQNHQARKESDDPVNFIRVIQEQLLDLDNMQIFLAFQPSQAQAELICNWFRNKFKNQEIIIEIQLEPQLVAGCILEYKGKRYDLSVSTKISNYVK